MAVEIYILSGARQGERLVIDRPTFSVGDGPPCEVTFDPQRDPHVRGRRLTFLYDEDGWLVKNAGQGEPLVNFDSVAHECRVRSGDIVRMSEFGPDFSFALIRGAAPSPAAPAPMPTAPAPVAPRTAPAPAPVSAPVSPAPSTPKSAPDPTPAAPQTLAEAWRSTAPAPREAHTPDLVPIASPAPAKTPSPAPLSHHEPATGGATPGYAEETWEAWEGPSSGSSARWVILGALGVLAIALVSGGIGAAIWMWPREEPPPPVPVLPRFATFTIDEGETWTIPAAAIGWNPEDGELIYRLEEAPPGAMIDEQLGEVAWTPDETQGPGEHALTVVAEPAGAPEQAARASLTVKVRETPQKPRVASLAPQTIAAGGEGLSLRIPAEDLDVPASNLVFRLGRGAPLGARIDPSSGRLTWKPTSDQKGEHQLVIEVRKADAPLTMTTATLHVTVE
jgi:hypothetical protein